MKNKVKLARQTESHQRLGTRSCPLIKKDEVHRNKRYSIARTFSQMSLITVETVNLNTKHLSISTTCFFPLACSIHQKQIHKTTSREIRDWGRCTPQTRGSEGFQHKIFVLIFDTAKIGHLRKKFVPQESSSRKNG